MMICLTINSSPSAWAAIPPNVHILRSCHWQLGASDFILLGHCQAVSHPWAFPSPFSLLGVDILASSLGLLFKTLLSSHLFWKVFLAHLPGFLPSFLPSFFLLLHLWHMEVPRPGVKWELQLSAYNTATAMPELSNICDLHRSLKQHKILKPLNEARDKPTFSWILVGFLTSWATRGPLSLPFWSPLVWAWLLH